MAEPRNRIIPTQEDINCVHRHFLALCKHFDFDSKNVAVQKEWVAIQEAYAGRPYHNLAHIAYLLRLFEKMNLPEDVMMEMRAAAIYHDIVYVTNNQSLYRKNEFLSAARGAEFLGFLKVPNKFMDVFIHRVMATLTHEIDPKIDYYGAVFLDGDMSILGAKPRVYRDYYHAIYEEFSNIPKETRMPLRYQFLMATSAKERIFKTDEAHARLDKPARANMCAEAIEVKAWMDARNIPALKAA